MQTMPKTWQPHPSETRTTPFHTIPWPFAKWGMDILDTFSPGKGQVKFLIVVVDYFTKWIEAKPLTTITAQQVQQFVWKDIICRYGVPHTIITDNGRQFIDKELAKFYTCLGIKHNKFCRAPTNKWTSRGGQQSCPSGIAQEIR